MVSRIDSSEKKLAFKKRSLRPWKPVVELDNAGHSDSKTTAPLFQNDSQTEFSHKPLHQPSEAQLTNKNKEREDIRAKLSTLDNTRITIGGFFQPKNVLFLDEKESSEKTFFLLNALKDKELEIAEINHQLKLAETMELVQKSAMELVAEQKARMKAEETARAALEQAQQTATYNQSFKDKLSAVEHIKNQLEHRTQLLENTLKDASDNFKTQMHAASKESERLQSNLQFEIELRKNREDELELIKMQRQVLERELNDKIQVYQELQIQLDANQAEIREKIAEGKILFEQTKKIHTVLDAERNLRKHFENQNRELAAQIFNLELRIKTEEYARKLAEDKMKKTLLKASEAVMDVLAQAEDVDGFPITSPMFAEK